MILDMLIPAIVEGQKMTMKQRLERLRKYEEKKEKDLDRNIDAVLNGAKRRLLPSQIDDRVRLIQQQMGTMLKTFGRVQPGFQINKMHAA
jgi:cobalamin biosynthesis protein CobT